MTASKSYDLYRWFCLQPRLWPWVVIQRTPRPFRLQFTIHINHEL